MNNRILHIHFRLNGQHFASVSQLLEYSKISNDLFAFLEEWFSKSNSMLVKTSGSTGKPKSICLQKKFMENSAKATATFFNLPPKTKVLCCLPINFIAGKMMLVRALTLGWHLDVVTPNSHPLEATNTNYHFSAMVPLQVLNSLKYLNRIKTLLIGGGDVSTSLQEKLQGITTKVYASYGMTETSTHIAIKKLNDHKVDKDSYFKTLPNIAISVDKRSCLVIDAPKIAEKKIVTNDIVKLISENEFEWKGRFDNVINSGGVKLHPESIEKKMEKHICQRFFVAGLPDETLGEKLVLVLEGKANPSVIRKKLAQVQLLHKYETPKEIFFIDSFLETETKKINRKETLKLLH